MTVNRYSLVIVGGAIGIVLLIVAALAVLGWALMTVVNYAMPTASFEVRLAVVIVVALVVSSLGGRSR